MFGTVEVNRSYAVGRHDDVTRGTVDRLSSVRTVVQVIGLKRCHLRDEV